MLTLAATDSWNVQSTGQNGGYGPDLMGLSADMIAYIQNFSPTLTQTGCNVHYPQIMAINKETASSGNDPSYATNTLTFSVTPTSISVQRASTPITRTFHF